MARCYLYLTFNSKEVKALQENAGRIKQAMLSHDVASVMEISYIESFKGVQDSVDLKHTHKKKCNRRQSSVKKNKKQTYM